MVRVEQKQPIRRSLGGISIFSHLGGEKIRSFRSQKVATPLPVVPSGGLGRLIGSLLGSRQKVRRRRRRRRQPARRLTYLRRDVPGGRGRAGGVKEKQTHTHKKRGMVSSVIKSRTNPPNLERTF